MSRIGRKVVQIPKGVEVQNQDGHLQVKSPKGSLAMRLSPHVTLSQVGSELTVQRLSDDGEARAHHGLMRNLISNLVIGVTTGFERKLEIVGVGFKAEVVGRKLQMNLGYSHLIVYDIPDGIDILVEKLTRLTVKGMDAQKVGQVAANIRAFREPDIYKAKGIRYEGEFIKVKAGKTGSK